MQTVQRTDLPGLALFRRGKVRDTYDLGDRLLIVATDRISAFDVVLPTPIPGKGAVLTQLSRFWFEQTSGLVPNHLISANLNDFPEELRGFGPQLHERAMIVRKAQRIDAECVIRGYLAGSAWTEYRATGAVGGETLPNGLRRGDRLPAPLFTPALKNDDGHDVNVSVAELGDAIGADLVRRLEEASRDLYDVTAELALRRGVILADSKFEFGFVEDELVTIDELVTPDSSRFWDAATYQSGTEPESFDKQFVRDWLINSGWDKTPPAPELPQDVVAATAARYGEAYCRLTGGGPLMAGG